MFIVFDGIDGTGKSTQINLLKTWLEEHNIEHITLREPGGSTNSEKIRKIFIKNKMEPITQLLLVGAARHENMKLLEENKDKVILCDRFIDSTYAYQGLFLEKELIDIIMDLTVTIKPDFTFLFLYQYKKKNQNHFDKLAIKKLEDLKDNFLKRYDPLKYFIVPADKTVQEINMLLVEKIKDLLLS